MVASWVAPRDVVEERTWGLNNVSDWVEEAIEVDARAVHHHDIERSIVHPQTP